MRLCAAEMRPLTPSRSAVVATEQGSISLTPEHVTIQRKTFKQSGASSVRGVIRAHVRLVREFTPNVIEPSFGFGRILYTLLEHAFWCREQDVERGVSAYPGWYRR